MNRVRMTIGFVLGLSAAPLVAKSSELPPYFAVAKDPTGTLYLSRAKCPVSFMTGRARFVQVGGTSEMCWRVDRKRPNYLDVCNVTRELTRKGEVGACFYPDKSRFIDPSSGPQPAF